VFWRRVGEAGWGKHKESRKRSETRRRDAYSLLEPLASLRVMSDDSRTEMAPAM
jgi:hypothetical protein